MFCTGILAALWKLLCYQ